MGKLLVSCSGELVSYHNYKYKFSFEEVEQGPDLIDKTSNRSSTFNFQLLFKE